MILNKKALEIGIIILLSLIPLLWFNPGYLITSVDVDYPLNPIHRLIVRSFSWYPQFQLGTDRSINFASLFVVGLQALFYRLGLSLITTEKLTYMFWFFLAGFSMYFLISQMIEGDEVWKSITRLTSVVAYMFNFYQFFVWARLQLGLSALILIPVFLGLLIKYIKGKITFLKGICFMAIVSFVCSSIGIQPPLIGSFLILIFLYLFFELILQIKFPNQKLTPKKFCFSIGLLGIFLLISSFWLIPLTNFIIQANYHSTEVGSEVYKIYDLAVWSSKFTSFLNIFRNFGDVPYFDKWGGVYYYPLFQQYQKNPLLILWGFLLVIFPIFSILLFRKNKLVIFFSIIFVIGLFLSKGLHPPFGNIYLWMLRYIPGFWIYRAPWQKFGIFATLSYSVLFGMTVGKIFQTLRYKVSRNQGFFRTIPTIFVCGIFIAYLSYHYPFISGKMFPSSEDKEFGFHQKFELGYHIKFPKYLFDSARWINSMEEEYNILLLPDDKTNVYEWGYGSSGDITLLLFNRGLLFRQYGEGMAPPSSVERVYSQFINSLYKNTTPNLGYLLKLLNTKYILQRNDFRYNFYGDTDSPKFIENRLSFYKEIVLENSFGKLDFYKISDEYFLPHICPSTIPAIVAGDIEALVPMTETKHLDGKPVLVFTEQMQNTGYQIPVKETNNFVFKDSNWRDLAVELSAQFTVNSERFTGKIEKTGIYEVWLDISELEEIPELEVRVGDREIVQSTSVPEHQSTRKYVKVGEVEIEEAGKKEIQVIRRLGDLENGRQNLKIILLSREERENVEKLIWQRMNEPESEVSYIFSQDGEFYVP